MKKKDSALGRKSAETGRDRAAEKARTVRKEGKGVLTKGWYGSWCVRELCWAGLCSAVYGEALTAEPKRSLI